MREVLVFPTLWDAGVEPQGATHGVWNLAIAADNARSKRCRVHQIVIPEKLGNLCGYDPCY